MLQVGYSATRTFEGGDWHDPVSWTNELIAGPGDDVSVTGSGIISEDVTVNNIAVGRGHTLDVASGTLTARLISIFPDGAELVNNAIIKLIIDKGDLDVKGNCKNTGTIEFIGLVNVSGSLNNSGTMTGSSNSLVAVGNGGVIDNFGTIDGTGVNFQINNGIFNNTAIINIDLTEPTNFVVASTGLFSNVGSVITNAPITVKDNGVLENRNIMDFINTNANGTSLIIEDDAIVRNFVNLQLTQLAIGEVGVSLKNEASFENFGLLIMKNAPVQMGVFGAAQFTNFATGEIYISNTDAYGLRVSNANTLAINQGIISLCQTNLVSGTCPLSIDPGTNLLNLPGSTLYTGIDIFNGNCSTTIVNNISNQGQIIASCGGVPNFSCPLHFSGVNAITGLLLTPQLFETNGPIEAVDLLINQGPIKFDSGTSITLAENFEVNSNTLFEAIIDGCGGI